MNTSPRSRPISSSSLSSSLPAWPTNGRPCLSSLAPGASPTNIRSASAFPEPNTTVVRVDASCGHACSRAPPGEGPSGPHVALPARARGDGSHSTGLCDRARPLLGAKTALPGGYQSVTAGVYCLTGRHPPGDGPQNRRHPHQARPASPRGAGPRIQMTPLIPGRCAVVGAGRLGNALAAALRDAGLPREWPARPRRAAAREPTSCCSACRTPRSPPRRPPSRPARSSATARAPRRCRARAARGLLPAPADDGHRRRRALRRRAMCRRRIHAARARRRRGARRAPSG